MSKSYTVYSFLIVNDGKTGTQMSDENCDYQNAERHSLIYAMNDELEERPNMMSQSENYLTTGESKGKNVNSVKYGNLLSIR